MQEIGRNYECPVTRTRARDRRDTRTYWIQKMADGRCWMLTNLAYAGGGSWASSYGYPDDRKTITNSNTLSYTAAYYMIPTGSNVTSGTTNPSTSTTGTGQYGYLYNWCAAMGNQQNTNACRSTASPASNERISICPSGWRLPTGDNGSLTPRNEVLLLTSAIGATSDAKGSTILRNTMLAMYNGWWYSGFDGQGVGGPWWGSTQHSSSAAYAKGLYFDAGSVHPTVQSNWEKHYGFSLRCIDDNAILP